jgi:hypothetical protein
MALTARIDNTSTDDSLLNIENWATKHKSFNKTSSHWWINDIPNPIIQHSIHSISHNKYIIESLLKPIPSSNKVECIYHMNELYIASKESIMSSDKVFTSRHIDGPFWFMSGMYVYRIIVMVNNNEMYQTVIGNDVIKLNKGDVVGFDFNRTNHLIEKVKDDHRDRIVLKLHYIVYKNHNIAWTFYKDFVVLCNIIYDRIARQIFLYTLNPTNIFQHIVLFWVLFITRTWSYSAEILKK